MRVAMAGLGYKTHYVRDGVANRVISSKGRITGKTLCGMGVTVLRETKNLELMSGSDAYCVRCANIKARIDSQE